MSNEQAAATATTLGYCYECDRQVQINANTFTCTVCGNGFIELLDEQTATTTASQAHANEQQQQQQQFPSFFRNANSRNGSGGSTNLAQFFLQSLMPMPQTMAGGGGGVAGGAASAIGGAGSGGGTSRIQVFVPGEQYDLYGMINNIFSDLLNPAGGGAPPSAATNMGSARTQRGPIQMFQIHGDPRDYAWGSAGLDSIITQLLNQLESTGPPPATDTQLNNLPSEKITQDHIEKNAQCAICMDEYKLTDETKKLPCKHYFHSACVTQWLRLHGTCPVCRKTLSGEDTSQTEYIRSASQQQDGNPPPPSQRDNPSGGGGGGGSSGGAPQPPPPPSSSSSSYYDSMDFD